MDPLKMYEYFLLKTGIFHVYVSLPEGNFHHLEWWNIVDKVSKEI